MSVIAFVPSFKKPGKTYEIESYGEQLYCECPAFQLGRSRPCKHLRLYRFAVDVVARCTHTGGTAAVCLPCLVSVLAAVARKRSIKREVKKHAARSRKRGA